MPKSLQLAGKKFGKLLVIRRSEIKKRGNYYWECICECGNEHLAGGWKLKEGMTKSCGCGAKEAISRWTTHNQSRTRTYVSWNSMIGRCYRKNSGKVYEKYGGRGIAVCERWKKFENFLKDMGERPIGTSIDRINPYGDYEPNNCRWATEEIQLENTRKNYDLNR